jgi:hypothetical protein
LSDMRASEHKSMTWDEMLSETRRKGTSASCRARLRLQLPEPARTRIKRAVSGRLRFCRRGESSCGHAGGCCEREVHLRRVPQRGRKQPSVKELSR